MLNKQYNQKQTLLSNGSYKFQETSHYEQSSSKSYKQKFGSGQNKGYTHLYTAKPDFNQSFSKNIKATYVQKSSQSNKKAHEQQQTMSQTFCYQAKNLLNNLDQQYLPELMSEQETNFQTENGSSYESSKSNSPKNGIQSKLQSQIIKSQNKLSFASLKPEFSQQVKNEIDSFSFDLKNFENLQQSNFNENLRKFQCSVIEQESKKLNDNSFDNIEIAKSEDEVNLSSEFQDADYLTAVNDNQSTLQLTHAIKLGENCDSLSVNEINMNQNNSNFQTTQSIQVNNESTTCSRRESFEMPVFPENQNDKIQPSIDIFSISAEQIESEKTQILQQNKTLNFKSQNDFKIPESKFKLDAVPFFVKRENFGQKEGQNQSIKNVGQAKTGIASVLEVDLDSLTLNNDFTPSTPYVQKFRTEMCKNWELYGKCKFGDECSFAHGKVHMMVKTDVSVLYKTKLCKKYSANGYCPYGMKCQFIHDTHENYQANIEKQKLQVQQSKTAQEIKPDNQEQNQSEPAQLFSSSVKAWTPLIKKVEPLETKENIIEDKPAITQQAVLNPESVAFIPSLPKIIQPAIKQQALPQKQAITAGGFGNKQIQEALSSQKIVYSEILVHNIHVSVQEFQKNLKINKKKLSYMNPQFEYVNIYSNTVPRLGCFANITENLANSIIDEEENQFINQCDFYYNIQEY